MVDAYREAGVNRATSVFSSMLAFNMVRDQLPHGILDDTPRNTGFVIGVYGDAVKCLSGASGKVFLD